jgi:hypothetical protein
VQKLGTAGEYQLSRKLYFNSIEGFANVTNAPDETTLAEDEAVYGECDNGPANGTSGNHCSVTCRCTLDFNEATGACN